MSYSTSTTSASQSLTVPCLPFIREQPHKPATPRGLAPARTTSTLKLLSKCCQIALLLSTYYLLIFLHNYHGKYRMQQCKAVTATRLLNLQRRQLCTYSSSSCNTRPHTCKKRGQVWTTHRPAICTQTLFWVTTSLTMAATNPAIAARALMTS